LVQSNSAGTLAPAPEQEFQNFSAPALELAIYFWYKLCWLRSEPKFAISH